MNLQGIDIGFGWGSAVVLNLTGWALVGEISDTGAALLNALATCIAGIVIALAVSKVRNELGW